MARMLTEIWEFCAFFWKVLCLTLTAAKKSVLPAGWLPRKSVEGKVVLVTGAGNGLGRLMAIEFAKLGARLVLWDIDEEANRQTKEALDQLGTGYEASSYRVDLACKEEIYAVAEQVKHDLGSGPDILVNNAGIAYAKDVLNLPDKVFDKTMAVNCNALFYTAKAFLPEMVARRQGHIVNIASMAGIAGVNRLMAYCVSKHGAIGFSDTLRAEMSAMGLPITVTTVCPYYVNTNMTVGIQTFSRLLPIMDADYVVHRIMDAVLTNADELYLPWAANLVVAFKGLLPVSVGLAINEYLQIDRTTEAFQGAEGAAKN